MSLIVLEDRVADLQAAAHRAQAVLDDLAVLPSQLSELARLRSRDVDLVDRLHADVTRLRAGEVAAATAPLVLAMLNLHDQMVRLGALENVAGDAALLRTQLLQALEVTTGVMPYSPEIGEPFDSSRHSGVRRTVTHDAGLDNTVSAVRRLGFQRQDATVLRAADVEVDRYSPEPAAIELEPPVHNSTAEPAAGLGTAESAADFSDTASSDAGPSDGGASDPAGSAAGAGPDAPDPVPRG
jgi:molecular chaperone GrpE (heat shock protein)